ncbi:MAG: ATP-binding cassette domain-containing protein [Geodermatophilaceae bacterium]|nr:ATP-binding cassette domain-containing protein [Geodermatophilaceae bacterium]
MGYLPQESGRMPSETIRDLLARRTGIAEAECRMNAAAAVLAARGSDRCSAALERWLALGGVDLAERAEKVLAQLGLGVGLDALTQTLSGGQAARAGLASLLLSRYDVLLLDEPTNDWISAGSNCSNASSRTPVRPWCWSAMTVSSWRAR